MFGAFIRVALYAVAIPLVIAILGKLLENLIPVMGAGGTEFAAWMNAISQWSIVISGLSLVSVLLARAVVESRVSR